MMFFDGFVIYYHNAMWRCGEIWWALGHLAKVPNFWQLDQKISMSRTSIDRISTLRWSYIENVDIFQRRFSSAFICSQPECSSTPNKKDMTKVLTFQRKFVFQCRVLWMPSVVISELSLEILDLFTRPLIRKLCNKNEALQTVVLRGLVLLWRYIFLQRFVFAA